MSSKSQPGKLKVFVSYSRADARFADELVAGLEFDGGFEVSIDRKSIEKGEDWKPRLNALIENADTIVFVLSPASATSEICRWEVERAAELKKRILPVLHLPLESTAPPPALGKINYIDFTVVPTLIAGIRDLATALRMDLGWVREATRLLNLALDWERAGRRDNRLLSGPDIVEAKKWLDDCPPTEKPTELHRDYIHASEIAEVARLDAERGRLAELASAQAQAAEQAKRVVRRTFAGLAMALLLAGLAAAAGGFAWFQRQEAETQRAAAVMQADTAQKARAQAVVAAQQASTEAMRAEAASEESKRQAKIAADERTKALREAEVARLARADADQQALAAQAARKLAAAERDQALISQSRFLSEQSIKAARSGDATTAALLALEALPSGDAPDARPLIGEAKLALNTAINSRARELRVISGHDDIIGGVDVSPDGKQVVTCSYDREAKTWDVESGRQIRVFRGHSENVRSCRFDDSGRRIVTAGWDGMIYVWNADNGDRLTSVEVSKGAQLGGARFSPDGKRIVLAGSQQQSWDAVTGREEQRSADERARSSAQFSFDASGRRIRVETTEKDTETLLTVFIDGLPPKVIRHRKLIFATELAGGARALVIKTGNYGIGIVSILYPILSEGIGEPITLNAEYTGNTPDGKTWIFRERDGSASIIDGLSTNVRHRIQIPSTDHWAPRFSKSGSRVAIAGTSGAIRIVDISSGDTTLLAGHFDRLYDSAFSADERYYVSSAEDGTARIWSIGEASRYARRVGSEAQFLTVNDQVILLATDAHDIELRDLKAGRTLSQLSAHAQPIDFFRLSPSKRTMLSDDGNATCVSDVTSELKLLKCRRDLVQVAALALVDDETLIYATQQGSLRLWRFRQDVADRTLASGLGAIESMIHDTLTGLIVVRITRKGEKDEDLREILAVDRATGAVQWREKTFNSAAAIRDGQVAAQRPDGSLIIFDLQSKAEKVAQLKGHLSGVKRMIFDATGKLLLSSSNTETLLWELPSGRIKRRFGRPVCGDYPHCGHWNLGFDTSSRRIVMSGWLDRYQGVETRIYDIDQEPPLLSVIDGGDAVGASLLDDGMFVYAATDALAQDKVKLSVYRLPELHVARAEALARVPRCLTLTQRAQYFLPATPPAWCIERRLWPFETDEWQDWLVKHKAWLAAGRQGDPTPLP